MGSPPRALSDSPAAVRKRRQRERQRETVTSGGPPVTPDVPVTPPVTQPVAPPVTLPAPAAVPWHETEPFNGPGPMAFARPLVLPANDNAPDAKPEPFAEPPPPPPAAPPSPLTPAQVAPFARGVTKFFMAGATMAMVGYQVELAAMGIDVAETLGYLPIVKQVVFEAAQNVAIKYRIRIPYQDEAIVVGAMGVAAFGFTKGRKRIAELQSGAAAANTNVPPDAKASPAADVTVTVPRDAPDLPPRPAPPTPRVTDDEDA